MEGCCLTAAPRGAVSLPFSSGPPEPRSQVSLPPPSARSSPLAAGDGGVGEEAASDMAFAISGQTMASFSSPNETFPLPNSSALSLAVVFVDNSYNEEAIKKSRLCCPAAASPYPFHKGRLPAQAEALMDPLPTRGAQSGPPSDRGII